MDDRLKPTDADEKAGDIEVIDLNTADEATLAGLAMIGPEKARTLIEHRPYKNWREVEAVIGAGTVDVLAMAGVQITRPAAS